MDLELLQQEAPVGAFSLDLLARDLNRSQAMVIIENQLEPTDHDHLGKLLTYAAGHDASSVIWIAPEIREEHRQALDWLNQHTDEHLEFFAVVVEVLRIDNSRPAFTFKPVVFPNEWRKGVVSEKSSPRAEKYRLFFQSLIDELRDHHRFTGARAGQPQNWYSFTSGHRGFQYALTFASGRRVRAELWIDTGQTSENKKLFDSLFANKKIIEEEYGGPLEWERLDDGQGSRIAVYRAGTIEDEPQLDGIRAWASVRQLPSEFVGQLIEAAINLHDRQLRRSERWTYLVPIWVALIAAIGGIVAGLASVVLKIWVGAS